MNTWPLTHFSNDHSTPSWILKLLCHKHYLAECQDNVVMRLKKLKKKGLIITFDDAEFKYINKTFLHERIVTYLIRTK